MPSVAMADDQDSSVIQVIVVGCGFAGLACAIECMRKGHNVTLLEKHTPSDILGKFLPQVLFILRIDYSIIGDVRFPRRCSRA
jgi:heterodisulfide reductase subunit A-like polyferredoxin